MSKSPAFALLLSGLMATTALAVGLLVEPQGASAREQTRDSFNRRIRVHNQTGWTMVKFQAADARSNAWRGDLLGDAAVATGASRAVTVDDGAGGCVYDFRAEFSNGQTLERDAVNVCEIADYYFTR